MLVEGLANLTGKLAKKEKEEVQVPNDIGVINYNFFIFKFHNHNSFYSESFIIQ